MTDILHGVLRWDAWYTHNGTPDDTVTQVERSLSPAEYHFRAPFFAEITQDGKIQMPCYTQETFDREMEYAIDAGIDHFSYVWYSHAGLRRARDFHLKSKYREEVKLTPCIDNNAIMKDYAHKEISELFTDPCFKKVLGERPLVYYFGALWNKAKITDDIAFYKNYCQENNIPSPYFVIMGVGPKDAMEMGGDAISRYSVSATDGIPFRQLMDNTVEIWERHSREGMEYNIQNVLPLVAGYHPLPRYKNPVTWMEVSENAYAQYATAEELYDHYKEAEEFIKSGKYAPTTDIGITILYAWNEHDEGGWICPTLKVDENGNQLYNADGTKQIDTSRIEAVKRAIKGL